MRKIKIMCLETNVIYPSMQEASLQCNISPTVLRRVSKDEKTYNGLTFKRIYKEKKEESKSQTLIPAYYGEKGELTRKEEEKMMQEAKNRTEKFKRNYSQDIICDTYPVHY